ncbi:MAG: WD40/YVTN/BNR-like repeat-containing protein [Caldimonas sp.]
MALDRPALSVRAPERAVLLGAALAGDRFVAVGERGIVALSDDGGHHWRQAPTPTSVTLTAVRFLDAKRGWVIGHSGVVLVTHDGGSSWTRQLDGRRAAQIVLEAARASGDGKLIADAERLVADGPDKPFLDLVISEKRLLVVGAYGLALVSMDGGSSWSSWVARLPNPKGLHLYAARQSDDTLLLAGERGLVLISQDDGQTFKRVETPYNGSFFAAELLTGPTDILLAGLRGNAMRSRDGGVNWTPVASPAPVSITATTVGPRGQLLAANQAGLLLSLQGERLVPLSTAVLPPLNGLLAPGSGPILALSIEGALLVPAKP